MFSVFGVDVERAEPPIVSVLRCFLLKERSCPSKPLLLRATQCGHFSPHHGAHGDRYVPLLKFPKVAVAFAVENFQGDCLGL
jgi:hypothetical protein